MEIVHKPGNTHFIPDALSRLLAKQEKWQIKNGDGELDDLAAMGYTVTVTSLEMPEETTTRIIEAYSSDKSWKAIYDECHEDATKQKQGEPATSSVNNETFYINNSNNLLYMIDDLGRHRLCLPEAFEKEAFEQAHEMKGHAREYKMLYFLNSVVVIRHVMSKVKRYLKYCVTCQLTSRPRHKPFGDYRPIITLNIPCLLYTSPSPRDGLLSRMPSSA